MPKPLTIHAKKETIEISTYNNGQIKLLHADGDFVVGTPLQIANIINDLYTSLAVNQFMDWYELM